MTLLLNAAQYQACRCCPRVALPRASARVPGLRPGQSVFAVGSFLWPVAIVPGVPRKLSCGLTAKLSGACPAGVAVPPFPAWTVEEVCKVLGDAMTGPQIPDLIAPLNVPEEPGGPSIKWKRLFNAVVPGRTSCRTARR